MPPASAGANGKCHRVAAVAGFSSSSSLHVGRAMPAAAGMRSGSYGIEHKVIRRRRWSYLPFTRNACLVVNLHAKRETLRNV